MIYLKKKLLNAIVNLFAIILTDGIEKGENAAEVFIVLLALTFSIPVLLVVVFLGGVYGFVRKLLNPMETLHKAMTE